MNNNVLVCVAWPYANGPRHIGHVAGFGVPSDVFARYQRMSGKNVLMVSGTDEHGTPLLVQADKEGVTVKELADRYNAQIVQDLAGQTAELVGGDDLSRRRPHGEAHDVVGLRGQQRGRGVDHRAHEAVSAGGQRKAALVRVAGDALGRTRFESGDGAQVRGRHDLLTS